jgi:hypothetical protein
MAKVQREDLFDDDARSSLLRAVRVEQGTAEAESFLSQVGAAVESYRKVYPKGRPNAEKMVTASRLLRLAHSSEVPDAIGRAAATHRWTVAVAEGEKFGKIGRLASQLVDQVGALSPDAKAVLAEELFLELSRWVDVGDVVKDLPRLKAACQELAAAHTLRGRRTPRVLRDDVQFLVDSVARVFVDRYTGVVKGWCRYRELEKEGHGRGEAALHAISAKARASFKKDLQDVLGVCSSAAGVQGMGTEDAIDLGGDRAWRHYCLPSLDRLRKEKRHKALWWLPVRESSARHLNDALGES